MPANLNALIRYKTINSCLLGGRRKWSIDELIAACSDALSESRGRYESVSERTIRDDIRVMRSDILGFNAPIEQHKGLYFYSDPAYSIMNVSITDSGLAFQIINLLSELKKTVDHPGLEEILGKLRLMTGWSEVTEKAMSKGCFEASMDYSPELPASAKAEELSSPMARKNLRFRITHELEWGAVMDFL
jgi:hypothetical protein